MRQHLLAEQFEAAGDASMSFDPLSLQGLLHACFTGLAAAEAADAWIAGDDDAVPRYLQLMNLIQQSYRRRLDLCYATETRRPRPIFPNCRLRD
jgi:flavin-dependent dehydrogenase